MSNCSYFRKKIIRILFFSLFMLLCYPLQAQEKAKPKEGEGVSSFLLRHNRRPSKYLDDFLKLNEGKFAKGNSLKLGVWYVIPAVKPDAKSDATKKTQSKSAKTTTKSAAQPAAKPAAKKKVAKPAAKQAASSSKTFNEPLFGKKYAQGSVKSKQLEGACFYVVGGHGGPDPGAIGKVGRHKLHEDEYAYDIILRLARSLMEEGAKVHIIIQDARDGIRDEAYLSNSKRETCMGKPIPLDQVDRLNQRCIAINNLYAKDRKQYKYCRAIFLHVDSRSKRTQTDVFFYHFPESKNGKQLAWNIRDTFEEKYKRFQPNRGFSGTVSARNLHVLRNTNPVSVFVEVGNIQNQFDQRRFVQSDNRQALANWITDGFIRDFKKH